MGKGRLFDVGIFIVGGVFFILVSLLVLNFGLMRLLLREFIMT